ncbi:unnamed protein product [Dovyalis caffra]|uniref:Uncharacterized protein n=1 Tax=Dovyalis caffra TaxID=77055 RepID=A0AAV1QZ62_9ROSI|nr:unnamed protein product [Dovyalis caffra]
MRVKGAKSKDSLSEILKKYKKVPGIKGQDHFEGTGVSAACYLLHSHIWCKMISYHKVGVEAARGRRYAGARAAIIFLFWVLLILAQLGFLLSVHEETGKLVKSLPRKVRFSETQSFHGPPTHDQPVDIDGRDPDTVYEDDKRIIHTGPNPLHN